MSKTTCLKMSSFTIFYTHLFLLSSLMHLIPPPPGLCILKVCLRAVGTLITDCHADLPWHLLCHFMALLLWHHLALLPWNFLAGLLVSIHTVVKDRLNADLDIFIINNITGFYSHLPRSSLTLNTRHRMTVLLWHKFTLGVFYILTSLIRDLDKYICKIDDQWTVNLT